MQKPRFFFLVFLLLTMALSAEAKDFTRIRRRLVEAYEKKDISQLETIESALLPQIAQDDMARFLLGKTLFLQEKVAAVAAGASLVNTPHLYTDNHYTEKAVLLIHGFTASPWEMSDLGKFLKKQGINAYAMRLAGHGTKPEDLLKIKWRNWYQTAEDGLTVTRLLGKEVYLVGLSLGGNLAFMLAAEKPQEIKGVVSLAPALYLQDWRSSLTGIARFVLKYNFRPVEKEYKPYYYEKRSVAAIWQLVKLMHRARRAAKNVTTPILIVQSRADKTVKPKGAQFLYDRVQSADKELVWLEESPHVLTTFENPQQSRVFEVIQSFLQK